MKDKKAKYEELANKLTVKYENDMTAIKSIIEAIESNGVQEGDSLETIVFKKYLELENVKNVADHINKLGYRVKTDSYIGERKYIGNDITEIIVSDAAIEKKLQKVVKELHRQHSIAMIKRYG